MTGGRWQVHKWLCLEGATSGKHVQQTYSLPRVMTGCRTSEVRRAADAAVDVSVHGDLANTVYDGGAVEQLRVEAGAQMLPHSWVSRPTDRRNS
jgi:hypothetical protein